MKETVAVFDIISMYFYFISIKIRQRQNFLQDYKCIIYQMVVAK